jgi:hypothetical protein
MYRVDGFCLITLYSGDGYLQKNEYKAYSINNITAKKESDGERPAVGQRLARSSGRGWPPVLESTGNCMRSGKDHRIVGGTR